MFQACPDFKGIKTLRISLLRLEISFKLALISKGLRLCNNGVFGFLGCFKLALISKGLRPNEVLRFEWQISFKLALISKGLRQNAMTKLAVFSLFQACPDFKGIKTLSPYGLHD